MSTKKHNSDAPLHDNRHAHGGNLLEMAKTAGCASHDLVDFSVNIHPEGTPDFIRAALFSAMANIEAYPSPDAQELKIAAASFYAKSSKKAAQFLKADNFVFGNGSNELIHALMRALKKQGIKNVAIVEPAFSEYALATENANLEITRFWQTLKPMAFEKGTGKEIEIPVPETMQAFQEGIANLAPNSAIFLANPSNPSGLYKEPQFLLEQIKKRPDILWIIDEAFIEYVDQNFEASLIPILPENALILRSLTKFHSVPGVRLGYLVSNTALAKAVQSELPAWNINAFAIAASLAIFEDETNFATLARETNFKNREHLIHLLSKIPCLTLFETSANYLLFRTEKPFPTLKEDLLKAYAIAIRDCSNYHGFSDNTWFRVAVRTKEDHEKLAHALEAILLKNSHSAGTLSRKTKKHTPALMLQGTSSDAGKSILAAAFCRIFKQDGYSVAPFKAQNMSLNSGVTPQGDEMGRAQIVQAQAAGIDPCARMNPILLKPSSDIGSQVIVCGKPIGHMKVHEYFAKKKDLWKTVTNTYDELASEYDIIVLEGAGSPAEINLKSHDIVNMRMAAHANAAVLLVGDIDRGGIYASLLGTWTTFNATERRLLTGYIINKFRGDASLLTPAHDYLLKNTKSPVLGVIPHIYDLNLPEEDMAGFSWSSNAHYGETPEGILDIAVIMLRHVSNYTDLAPLTGEPDVRVRPIRSVEEWGNPDVLIIPGSKSVVPDLEQLHESGLAKKILEHAKPKNGKGKWVFGICGGLQILGKEILDPHHIETDKKSVKALGIMDLSSTFAQGKTLVHVPYAKTPLGVDTSGYEIHHGITEHGASALPLFLRADKENSDKNDCICGYVTDKCWATYLHGVFDDNRFRRAWINHIRVDIGLESHEDELANYDIEKNLDRLADIVRANTDMNAIYEALGIKKH